MNTLKSFLSALRPDKMGFLLLVSIPLFADRSFAQRPMGVVTSKTCPYSCKSQGIAKRHCRDWKEQNICFVEDLRRRQNTGKVTEPERPELPVPPQPPSLFEGNSSALQSCEKMRDIERPEIFISEVTKRTNQFQDQHRVRGTIEGTCLVDAGLFYQGRKDASVQLATLPYFKRFDFDFVARGDRNPEIRAYNSAGGRAIAVVDPRDPLEYHGRDTDSEVAGDVDRNPGTGATRNPASQGSTLLDELFGRDANR